MAESTVLLHTIMTELIELEQTNFPWASRDKIDRLKHLLLVHAPELRNRRSQLHLSASALVFCHQTAFFIRHPYLKTTLLPAGHVEPNELPAACARREFHEETGYQLQPNGGRLIDLNLISIPANPIKGEGAHQHIDFRFNFNLLNDLQDKPELPVFCLPKTQAPKEFARYFDLILR
jgi:hypothetical protein